LTLINIFGIPRLEDQRIEKLLVNPSSPPIIYYFILSFSFNFIGGRRRSKEGVTMILLQLLLLFFIGHEGLPESFVILMI